MHKFSKAGIRIVRIYILHILIIIDKVMKKLAYTWTLLISMLVYSQKTYALVFVPPLLLIPIAKLIAVILGGLALPTLGISTIVSKGKKNAILRTLLFFICVLIVVGILTTLFLKIQNPSRPWF